MKALLCLLLCGCMPHVYKAGYSRGSWEVDRPFNDPVTEAISVGVEWWPETMAYQDKMLLLTTAGLSRGRMSDEEIAAMLHPQEEGLAGLAAVPDDIEGGWVLLQYGAYVLLLVIAAVHLKKNGFKVPWFSEKKDE